MPSHPVRQRSQSVRRPLLPLRTVGQGGSTGEWPPLWWVGCHGGAGTTTLAMTTELGVDVGTAWPVPMPGEPPVRVVLACRATASGVRAATVAVEQFRRQPELSQVQLLGVVAVAASPRRPPRRVAERLRVLAGWTPAMWRVGWIEEYLAVDDPRDIGVPPDIAALRHTLSRALTEQ